MNVTKTKSQPSHRVYAVTRNGNKSFWREIGAAWAHADGKGFSLKLDFLPLNGADISIREPMAEQSEGQEGGGGAMSAPRLTADELRQFLGSEEFYRHGLVRQIVFTEGAEFLADKAGAYWLLDEIALAQRYTPAVAAEEFQVWKLTVADDRSAMLACEDGNAQVVFSKKIDWTDFPLPEVALWFANGTIFLPSEY